MTLIVCFFQNRFSIFPLKLYFLRVYHMNVQACVCKDLSLLNALQPMFWKLSSAFACPQCHPSIGKQGLVQWKHDFGLSKITSWLKSAFFSGSLFPLMLLDGLEDFGYEITKYWPIYNRSAFIGFTTAKEYVKRKIMAIYFQRNDARRRRT